jgi:hypothetical protein
MPCGQADSIRAQMSDSRVVLVGLYVAFSKMSPHRNLGFILKTEKVDYRIHLINGRLPIYDPLQALSAQEWRGLPSRSSHENQRFFMARPTKPCLVGPEAVLGSCLGYAEYLGDGF